MAEGIKRNVAVELAVDARQDVELELGGNALRVVVSSDQPLYPLHAVHADQQLRARAQHRAELAKQVGRARRDEIADGRAGEEAELGALLDSTGQRKWPREVGDDRDHFQSGEALLQLGRALLQIIAADVDRDIGGGRDRFEQ